MDNPQLIEYSAKSYIFNALRQCHMNRTDVYFYVLNIGILILFLGIVGTVLYYCNKSKLSDYDKKQKILADQKYVLSKIRYYQDDAKTKKESQFSGITNLPHIDMSP